MAETRNSKLAESFYAYCKAHPYDRFWQALLNWSGLPFIFASGMPIYEVYEADKIVPGVIKDTYDWEGRNG
jgi:hypothetical protein